MKFQKLNLQLEDKKVIATLTSVNGSDGYQLYGSTKKNGKYSLLREFSSEEELLEGIKVETPKEEGIMPPVIKKPILKNNGELYLQDLAVLKLTNPYKFEQMEKKEESDMKFLRKKLEDTRKKYENSLKK